jgi:hypothetical protein
VLPRRAADGDVMALMQRELEVPGMVACFKVYVVLKTGNERAQNP